MNRKEKADLANIELMFPSELFLKGEELHEASGVLECIKLEKNLYTFIIQDGKRYEVEWLKPLTRQQRASCECSFFKAEKICKHAIAALIAYKQLITEELESTQVERRQSTLSISNILNHVSKEELKNFLKTYAQTDRRLATALKVHFARRVDLQDNEKKYKSILDAVIRPVTSGNDKFKASEVKSLSQIANEFFDQAEDALALGEHSEAFILTKTALTKLCYTYHHGHYHETKLETDILRAHEILYQLSGWAKSQELVVAIRHFLAEIAHFSYYPYLSLRHNALMMLLKQQAVPEDAIHIAETQLKRKRDSEVQIVVLLSMIMLIGESQQQDHDIDHRYFTYLEKVASLLVSNGYYKTAANMCHKYRTVSKDMPLWHLKALAMLEKKELIAEAVSYFVAGKDLRIIELLKPLHSERSFTNSEKKLPLPDWQSLQTLSSMHNIFTVPVKLKIY
ncbi:MAG: SWIM zinc finger family protein [Saprospiraceae bacterium]|nr:SWIM zinc finger family protein [Saprospiraceae bacterium]